MPEMGLQLVCRLVTLKLKSKMKAWLIFGEVEEKTIFRILPRKAMSPLFTRNYAKENQIWTGPAELRKQPDVTPQTREPRPNQVLRAGRHVEFRAPVMT
jgi:hypothetical protein